MQVQYRTSIIVPPSSIYILISNPSHARESHRHPLYVNFIDVYVVVTCSILSIITIKVNNNSAHH